MADSRICKPRPRNPSVKSSCQDSTELLFVDEVDKLSDTVVDPYHHLTSIVLVDEIKTGGIMEAQCDYHEVENYFNHHMAEISSLFIDQDLWPDTSILTGGPEAVQFPCNIPPSKGPSWHNLSFKPNLHSKPHFIRLSEQHIYMELFFSEFSCHFPLVHEGTWRVDDKPAILLRVMQACGALFVRTTQACNFIWETLITTDKDIAQAFATLQADPISDPLQQLYLAVALALLQSLAMFHENASERKVASTSSGMLKSMISRTGILESVHAWMPMDLRQEGRPLEDLWESWVKYETAKRICYTMAILQDCDQIIFFGLPSTSKYLQFGGHLPSEDSLWTAKTAEDWADLLGQHFNPWEYIIEQLKGPDVQSTISSLFPPTPMQPIFLSSLSSFIILHITLTAICIRLLESFSQSTNLPNMFDDNYLDSTAQKAKYISTMQFALQNWLRNWKAEASKPSFNATSMYNCCAVPCYRLAQILLLLLVDPRAETPSLAKAFCNTEVRCRAFKNWMAETRRLESQSSVLTTQNYGGSVQADLGRLLMQLALDAEAFRSEMGEIELSDELTVLLYKDRL
ncbi:hypothetical protein M422DRAFT_238865 [Sphaerobolus stellatus SS14]|nr:hypothetical protein M422DRAFT_238865 [Sphaerobolus stellatus SS14]